MVLWQRDTLDKKHKEMARALDSMSSIVVVVWEKSETENDGAKEIRAKKEKPRGKYDESTYLRLKERNSDIG